MDVVEQYYDKYSEDEWERLKRHRIEFEITKRYMQNYITEKAKILDVGGGPGRYTLFLAEQSHKVTLFDISSKNIKIAKERITEKGVKIEKFIHGNVLDITEHISEQYDVVLCMGPLYHLTEEKDRIKAIQGCLEVLKDSGLLFVTFISAYAPIIDTIKKYPEKIIDNKENLLNYLKDGRNIVSEDNPGFTTAYFINPNKIEEFMNQFNLEKLVLSGVEGIPSQSEEKINSLSEEAFQEWLDIIYQTSTEPVTWASCEHLLYIGKKT